MNIISRLIIYDIFLSFAPIIDIGYSLEPPKRVPTIIYVFSQNKKYNVYHDNSHFSYINEVYYGVDLCIH